MKYYSKLFTRSFIVSLLLFILAIGTVSAWWSGWFSPNFRDYGAPHGQYSPTGYRHGHWDSPAFHGSEGFGSQMMWNSSQAKNVRYYSSHKVRWYRSKVFRYYTHDHTDKNRKLHGRLMFSNFPNPKYDKDGWWRVHEMEVTSLNKNFPRAGKAYGFYTRPLAKVRKVQDCR